MNRGLILAVVTVLIMTLPMVLPAAASPWGVSVQPEPRKPVGAAQWKAKVDESLLEDKVYGRAALPGLEESLNGLAKFKKVKVVDSPPEGLARVAIYFYGGQKALQQIKEKVYRVTSALAPGQLGVAYALATKDQVREVASLPFVVWVEPQKPITDMVEPVKPVREKVFAGGPAQAGGGSGTGYMFYSAPTLLGADRVWSEYGITGEGVKVGVVDTGIDLGAPDLGPDKIARDEDGMPLIFDADMVGFTFTGNPTERIDESTIYIPGWYEGYILGFVPLFGSFIEDWSAWVYAYNRYTGQDIYLEINVTNETYTIPSNIQGNITFGLLYEYYYLYPIYSSMVPILGAAILATPVIVVDVDGDGTFDGFYVDISTGYYLLMEALHEITNGAVPAPPEELADKSFADEPFITYGNEVIARDFTGDGVPDFSLGALAAATYDYWGLFDGNYYLDWLSDWEPGALVVPGFDQQGGQWVDIVYDFHGHGTSVAHVIAASGEVERPVESAGFQGNVTMPGIAKGASVGGAPALFNGDVVTAQLWLAGFDLVDPATFTWTYTGRHQVDVISNSWGSSWLLYNGYANDADPTGMWQAYIMAVSGTVIVHAAGNGGPGWGTVTMPGASPLIITVGAATDFYYRPFFGPAGGVAYLPGGWGQVISWSDRGPTQLGFPKPDVINIGSFEWAGTRAVDALWDGRYTYDLFGGTSEATPMTSGVVALMIQALRQAGIDYDPFLVKVILKSTARDMGYNPFSQGSGFVNAYAAVKTVLEGGVIAYSYQTPHIALTLFDETFAAMLGITVKDVHALFFQADAKDTALYPGVMKPGDSKTLELKVKVLGGGNASVELYDYAIVKKGYMPLSKALNVEGAFLVAPSEGGGLEVASAQGLIYTEHGEVYLNLTALPPGTRLVIPVSGAMASSDFAVLDLAIPADFYFAKNPYDPYGRPYTDAYNITLGPELSVWFDVNGNGVPDASDGYWEVARLGYDIREGPVAHLELGNAEQAILNAAVAASSVLGVSPDELVSKAKIVVDLRVFYNTYYGTPGYEEVPLKGGLGLYTKADCKMIHGYPETLEVNGEATVPVEVSVPAWMQPGVYEAYLVVESGSQEILVPVSIPVAYVVDLSSGRSMYTLTGSPQPFLYDNYVFRGALDQGWRPETGDWRTYPILVKDPGMTASTLTVKVYWRNLYAGYDAGLIGPGLNLWGVADYDFVTYTDAAVLGAKLTMPYLTANSAGVYDYFDWPEPGMASFIAALDPLRPLRTGEEYTLYWLVIHQKFSDQPAERVLAIMHFGKMLGGNEVAVEQGGTTSKTMIYYGPQYMPYTPSEEVIGVTVIPMEGQASAPTVDANVRTAGTGSLRIYKVTVDATEADAGDYLAVVTTYSDALSVAVGVNYYGDVYILYYTPLVYNVALKVSVQGG